MATLHKIMLAIASSWNNGTSSPAPQGNRALSNQTNALASAIQLKPPMKARLASSAPILVLLAGIFIFNQNGMAYYATELWTPYHSRTTFLVDRSDPEDWTVVPYRTYRSEYYAFNHRDRGFVGYAEEKDDIPIPSAASWIITYHLTDGRTYSTRFFHDSSGNLRSRYTSSVIGLTDHKKWGRRTIELEDKPIGTGGVPLPNKAFVLYRNWSFTVYGSDTTGLIGSITVRRYVPFFTVTNPWVSEDEESYSGKCERPIVSIPGPKFTLRPCLPGNMRYHINNRYFIYHVGLRKIPKRSRIPDTGRSERPKRPD